MNDNEGLFVAFFLLAIMLPIAGFSVYSVYRDINPTPEMIKEKKENDRCSNKCNPNYGKVIKSKCYCHIEYVPSSK